MYDYLPMRDHAERIQRSSPKATVRYYCALNNITIAGFPPIDPDGSIEEFTLNPSGFITKPRRIVD